MIKLLLKHTIYDHAISVFFEQVTYNFIYPTIKRDVHKMDYLLRKWAPVLNYDFSDTLSGDETVSVIAVLLESQVSLNEKYHPGRKDD